MKLTVLGCNGPFPAAGGACSGYLLEEGSTRVLLDCGTGTLARLTALVPPEALDAIVLSHLHYDHMSDMLPLIYALQGKEKRLIVYAPQEPASVRALLAGAFDLRDIAQGGQIGPLRMTALPVRHPVPSYATRFEASGRAFCYTGDTNTCAGLAAFAAGCDLLLADACFPGALWAENKPHLSARLAAELAREAGAARLVLTHFRPDIPTETLLAEAREVFPAAMAAESSLTIEF
ncbi:MAG: MBL fold metallo-hydrolase [Clostridia bacterium]|nr:MBL fold metallo-hydrolase [Clostridia bacterium]